MGIPADVERALRQLKIRGKAHLQRRRPHRRTERTPAVPPGTNGSAGQWAGRGQTGSCSSPIRSFRSGTAAPGPERGVILTISPVRPLRSNGTCSNCARNCGVTNWEQTRIDFLFVESAWNGKFRLLAIPAHRLQGAGRRAVRLVEWCRAHGIPTVFWNKEDPPHYDDFLPAARLFDHVFTSDSDRIADYVRDLGHHRVAVFPSPRSPPSTTPCGPDTEGTARRGFRRNVFRPQVSPTPRPDGHAARRGHAEAGTGGAGLEYSPASSAGTQSTSSRRRWTRTWSVR